jgi:hypothetical protein
MSDDQEAGEVTQVYTRNGCFDVSDSIDRVDAQVTAYLESGGTRNAFVHLTSFDGDPIRLLASAIVAIGVSTPAGRRNATRMAKARQDEANALRAEVGYLPGEDEF